MLKIQKNLFFKSAWTCILFYVGLYLSAGLNVLSTFSPWLGFLICTVLSVGSLVLSVISIIKETRRGLSFLAILLAIFLLLFTVFIFLLPEAGIPPAISLFYD